MYAQVEAETRKLAGLPRRPRREDQDLPFLVVLQQHRVQLEHTMCNVAHAVSNTGGETSASGRWCAPSGGVYSAASSLVQSVDKPCIIERNDSNRTDEMHAFCLASPPRHWQSPAQTIVSGLPHAAIKRARAHRRLGRLARHLSYL